MTDDSETVSAGPVQVHIFNRTYNLRSGGDRDYVVRVAQIVDERMRQVSALLTTSDVAKVAVLAALNLAGELEDFKARYARAEQPEAPDGPDGAETRDQSEAAARRSWFEEIFDGEMAQKNSDERLSSLVSSKLQRRRQPGDETPTKDDGNL